MALASIRGIIRCGQIATESIVFNSRSIAFTRIRKTNTVEEKKTQEGQNSETATSPPNVNNEEIEKLNKEISTLTESNQELLDKYKRALADGENMRNRLTKQIAEAKIYGIQNFCKDLLDVADVLSKATETVPKEQISNNNPYLKSLYEGLVMTEAQLKSVFKRHGLEPVDPLNQKFDPNFHEALFQQEVAGKDSGTVVVVQKIGYKLHERVIRPALVGVAK